jgi:hypothetical protein
MPEPGHRLAAAIDICRLGLISWWPDPADVTVVRRRLTTHHTAEQRGGEYELTTSPTRTAALVDVASTDHPLTTLSHGSPTA